MGNLSFPAFAILEVLTCQNAIDSHWHLLSWLRLPFCYLVKDVLDYLGIVPAQLHPISWQILMTCCFGWRRVLELVGEEYPDLTDCEIVFTHAVGL